MSCGVYTARAKHHAFARAPYPSPATTHGRRPSHHKRDKTLGATRYLSGVTGLPWVPETLVYIRPIVPEIDEWETRMRALFSLVGILIAVAVVGVLIKRQLNTQLQVPSVSQGAPTPIKAVDVPKQVQQDINNAANEATKRLEQLEGKP
jgi:hypothetical protein